MSGSKITSAQLTVWIITALIGPLAFFSDGNWMFTLLAAVLLSLLNWLAVRFGKHWEGPIYAFVQMLWISVLLSQILTFSADCWPTGQRTYPVIPIAMLVLAILTAIKGEKSAANSVSVLFWVSALLLGIVILFGISNVITSNLKPEIQMSNSQILLVLALPAVTGMLNKERSTILPFVVVAAVAVCISLWISGTLSQQIAEQLQWPFYSAAKSVQILDVAKRFEALVSVGVTIGNYALYSMMLCAAGSIGQPFGDKKRVIAVTGIVAGVLMLAGLRVHPTASVIICLILWVLFPLFGLISRKEKE